jgi:hypothetical protein
MSADQVVLRRGDEKCFRNLVFRTRGDGDVNTSGTLRIPESL